ncbi:MAG TPA: hypothetical protein VG710_13170 [Opitutus sp.]|nr:hypothetical protein [Opitutus sp.]
MSRKIDRKRNGPGWGEVILGAILSLVLGAVLGAVYLVFKPVAAVKEVPKDAPASMVYYIEGTHNAGSSAAEAKQRQLVQGGSVDLREDDLNALFGGKSAAPKAKPAVKGKDNAKDGAPAEKMISADAPNFRIHGGVMQIGVPVRVAALGLDEKVIVQARGVFSRTSDGVVFSPSEFLVGSCPVQRLPGVSGLLMKRLAAAAEIPPAVATAWGRVTDATVDGSTLHLAVQ